MLVLPFANSSSYHGMSKCEAAPSVWLKNSEPSPSVWIKNLCNRVRDEQGRGVLQTQGAPKLVKKIWRVVEPWAKGQESFGSCWRSYTSLVTGLKPKLSLDFKYLVSIFPRFLLLFPLPTALAQEVNSDIKETHNPWSKLPILLPRIQQILNYVLLMVEWKKCE